VHAGGNVYGHCYKDTLCGDELLLTFGDEEVTLSEFARLYREYAELETAADAAKHCGLSYLEKSFETDTASSLDLTHLFLAYLRLRRDPSFR
jgi:hypothetical protein